MISHISYVFFFPFLLNCFVLFCFLWSLITQSRSCIVYLRPNTLYSALFILFLRFFFEFSNWDIGFFKSNYMLS